MQGHVTDLGRISCICNYKSMPQYPMRKIWKDTCALRQAHCEKWPDCHSVTVLFSQHLHGILSYYNHSTQCSIKRRFLSNQINIIVQPEEYHQISRKPSFQILNWDSPPDICYPLYNEISGRKKRWRKCNSLHRQHNKMIAGTQWCPSPLRSCSLWKKGLQPVWRQGLRYHCEC